MKNNDMYWMNNRDWWEFKDHVPVVKDDAPLEAKESYQRYLKQMSES